MLQRPPAQREGEAGACGPGDPGAALRSFISGQEGAPRLGLSQERPHTVPEQTEAVPDCKWHTASFIEKVPL